MFSISVILGTVILRDNPKRVSQIVRGDEDPIGWGYWSQSVNKNNCHLHPFWGLTMHHHSCSFMVFPQPPCEEVKARLHFPKARKLSDLSTQTLWFQAQCNSAATLKVLRGRAGSKRKETNVDLSSGVEESFLRWKEGEEGEPLPPHFCGSKRTCAWALTPPPPEDSSIAS